MSYCRFSEDSDAYIYNDVYGGWTCCACLISEHSYHCKSIFQLFWHVIVHKFKGHQISNRTIMRILSDIYFFRWF